jgi:[acyl-carrier-protein] S-malonyltransferase
VPRIALCFPGQGSQTAGMAAGIVDTDAGRALLDVASADGVDLEQAFAGSDEDLRPTELAQPALFLVENVLGEQLREHAIEVVAVAGHSVGEYAAAGYAGALPAAGLMGLVIERGRAMAAMQEGTMAAVIGMDPDDVAGICRGLEQASGTVVVANINAPGQVVISGTVAGVEAASARCRQAGARRVMPLNVSGAFHSPLMREAGDAFAARLERVELQDPTLPVVCNVDGREATTAADLRDRMRRQLTSAVQWTETVRRLVTLGAEALVEVGPGSVLSGLNRRIAPDVPCLSVSSLDEAASLPGRLGVAADG